jgi:ribosomal-protein-serine acetyltransferase
MSFPLGDDAELRPLEPWHAAEFSAHVETVRDHLAPWILFAHTVIDAESARSLLQRYADEQARGGGRIFGIWVGGRLRGGTLFRVFNTGMGVCELGAWIAPDLAGRGLITRAASAMIDWAVGERGIHRVEWWCDVDNAPSQAVARRLGMHRDGVMRELLAIDGRGRRDIEVWSVLAPEWLTMPGGSVASLPA